jgi:hypothetical protein
MMKIGSTFVFYFETLYFFLLVHELMRWINQAFYAHCYSFTSIYFEVGI